MQTILAVDDEEENLLMVEHTLSREYRVVPVNSGNMAFKYLQKEIPDLILLDIKMPQMDGFEVLNTLRQNAQWKTIPVVFLSSYNKIYSDAELMQSGVADYIGKPFDAGNMKNRISLVMNQMRDEVKNGRLQFEPLTLREERIADMDNEKKASIPVTIDDMVGELEADKIICIEKIKNRYIISTRHFEVSTPLDLDQIQNLLGESFIRVGRNILVNTAYIKTYLGNKMVLEGDRVVKVTETYRDRISGQVLKQISNKIK